MDVISNWPVVLTLAALYATVTAFVAWNDLQGIATDELTIRPYVTSAKVVAKALAWPVALAAIFAMALLVAVVGSRGTR